MTLEHSLRRRANSARFWSNIWTGVAVLGPIFCISSYYFWSSGFIDSGSRAVSVGTESSASITYGDHGLLLPLVAMVSFSVAAAIGYFAARVAYIDRSIAYRLSGLADALLACGGTLEGLEKAASIFVPHSRLMYSGNIINVKDVDPLLKVIEKLRVGS